MFNQPGNLISEEPISSAFSQPNVFSEPNAFSQPNVFSDPNYGGELRASTEREQGVSSSVNKEEDSTHADFTFDEEIDLDSVNSKNTFSCSRMKFKAIIVNVCVFVCKICA